MSYMDQSRRDESLTATLPAWAWRMIVYSVEHMAEYRASLGHNEVSTNYQYVCDALTKELGVESSGDLPTSSTVPPA